MIRFKHCIIATLLALLAATPSSAVVHLSPSGEGQVLLYPYYSAQGGLDTLLSVVNQTDQVKAVRVRFLDAVNARTVAQLNLYLGSRDTWVAAVTSTGAMGARLIRADDSCTVPAIPDEGLVFDVSNFGEYVDRDGDGRAELPLLSDSSRTADGYIEVLDMGVIDERIDVEIGGDSGLEAAARSDSRDCARLVAAWSASGVWTEQRNHDIAAPSGGLAGAVSLIDVAEGIEWSYRATAIAGFFAPDSSDDETASTRATLHFPPSDPHPHLADINTESITGNSAVARSLVLHDGQALFSDWDLTRAAGAGAADPVSALLMAATLRNEVVHDAALDGLTNWVLTYPTMRFYLPPSLARSEGAEVADANPPFAATSSSDLALSYYFAGRIIEQRHSAWTREGDRLGDGSGCGLHCGGPDPFDVDQTMGAAAVLLMGEREDEGQLGVHTDTLFGTDHSLPFAVGSSRFIDGEPLRNGVAEIDLFIDLPEQRGLSSLPETGSGVMHRYFGLPVIGFSASRIVNGTLVDETGQRIRANYGKAVPHVRVRRIESDSSAAQR